MIQPQTIQRGDKIRIVSPAGKLKPERVQPAVTWLEQQGYKVDIGQHVFAEHFQYAGTDTNRLADVQEALDDADCKAIICARGGYGTVRIIDELDFSEFIKYPKWVVGYSDITALHLAVNKLGCGSIHGTMPPFFFDKNGEANKNLKSLMDVLQGREVSYQFQTNKKQRQGTAEGEMIGGNLSLLTSLIGSEYELDTDGKILFVEDIDEYLYHIDRMMRQLKLSGKLDKLSGLIVGDFTEIKDNDDPFGQTLEEIVWEVVKDYNYPVCFGLKAGHDDVNLALAFGQHYQLAVSNENTTLKKKYE